MLDLLVATSKHLQVRAADRSVSLLCEPHHGVRDAWLVWRVTNIPPLNNMLLEKLIQVDDQLPDGAVLVCDAVATVQSPSWTPQLRAWLDDRIASSCQPPCAVPAITRNTFDTPSFHHRIQQRCPVWCGWISVVKGGAYVCVSPQQLLE